MLRKFSIVQQACIKGDVMYGSVWTLELWHYINGMSILRSIKYDVTEKKRAFKTRAKEELRKVQKDLKFKLQKEDGVAPTKQHLRGLEKHE